LPLAVLGFYYSLFLCLPLASMELTLVFSASSERKLDLTPLLSSPKFQFDQSRIQRLPGAHGEEVVRSVFFDEQVKSLSVPVEGDFSL